MNKLIELAEDLIRCPSITPHDHGCQSIIANFLTPLGFHCEALPFEEVNNLWARIGNAAPLFVFAGHTDVVPPGLLSQWTTPPFQPDIRENHLYGRGTTDMKGAIAAMLIAVERFINEHPNFSGSIGFLITSDEEGDALNGTQKVIEYLQQQPIYIDYCLVGEASSEKTVGDQIRIGRRGSLHGHLTLHGKQSHVAYPSTQNPIHLAAPLIQTLANTVWDEGNDYFPPTSFQITNIKSGTGATNVIPSQLEMMFNFRFSTASTIESLQTKITAIIDSFSIKYDLNWKIGGLPFLCRTGKLLEATQHTIKEQLNVETHLSTSGGTSDGRFIAPIGTEVLELGVIYETAHQVNERVNIQQLQQLSLLYYGILVKLFGDGN